MKNTLIASALIALSLAASGNALAQRSEHDNERGYQQQHGERHDKDRGERADHKDSNDGARGNDDRQRYDARNYRRDDKRGGGPRHDLRRGGHLGKEYRDSRYVVSDWRDRHLSAPPKGHHWVRAGNDYVLAAVASGLIAQVLLSN